MVKVLKLTDKNSGHQDLRTTPFTLSFNFSLSPTEDLLLRGSKIGLRPLGGLLLSPKGFPLLRRPLAPPCRVIKLLHGLVTKVREPALESYPSLQMQWLPPGYHMVLAWLTWPGSRTPPQHYCSILNQYNDPYQHIIFSLTFFIASSTSTT